MINGSKKKNARAHGYQPLRDILNGPHPRLPRARELSFLWCKTLIAPSTTHASASPSRSTSGLLPFSVRSKCGSRPRPREDEIFVSFFVFDVVVVVVEDVLLRLFSPFIAYLYTSRHCLITLRLAGTVSERAPTSRHF
jgi:hypothetical protein